MEEKQDTTKKEAAIAQAYAAYLCALAARDSDAIKAPAPKSPSVPKEVGRVS